MSDADSIRDDEEQLAAFQAALLDILDRFEDPAEILCELKALDVAPEYRDWVKTFDPAMAEVAAILTKKWGVRRST
ncbi:MAG: hypothetical protein H8E37_01170 [Planctomycetes bacterium]|nr:hypothetical protein [Planctomycetota bacterium]